MWMIASHRKFSTGMCRRIVGLVFHHCSFFPLDGMLARAFKQKINELLVSLLKLDPLERMTFPEFFDFVDDLMKSKVEVVNLLQGTSFKFMMDTAMT